MSADLLRRAATTLREHTEAATPGPWRTVEEIDGVRARRLTVVKAGERRVVTVDQTRPHHKPAEANVALISLMHPPVPLALAVVLDDWADQLDRRLAFNIPATDVSEPLIAHLIDVARAILREVP